MKKVKALYVGKRLNGDKLHHLFMVGEQRMFFGNHRWGIIGNWYYLLKEGKGWSKPRRAEHAVGPEQTKEDILQWEADEAVAEQHRKRMITAQKLNKTPRFLESIETLKATLKKAQWNERKAILEWLFDWSDT